MTDRDRILEAVDILAPTVASSGLDELELTVGELHVRLSRARRVVAAPAVEAALAGAAAGAAATQPASAPPPPTPFGEPAPGRVHVTAPLTGVWYPAPSPGARPYVTEGHEVTVGQVVGLIEAMKLFNEIKSDKSGTVTRVLVENGTLVKRRQPLLEIDPR
ncbi:MAG TPA: acetyl-CoA carboxylase biotin carboxyl carrier protein [Candidatus Limnocylindria bacterium]|nr:acetyl-CoA carboxylase biotin carboxyl carrier protein [Candidatus Limnocylindria bacterium]